MRTDDEIIAKIWELKSEYIGLQNKESKELCKFLSYAKIKELVFKKKHSFEIILNGSIICQIKKQRDISIDEFIVLFSHQNVTDSMILSKLKKTLQRLWKRNKGYFEWSLLEDFELLRVYSWLLQYDDLSKHLIQNSHQPEECLILCSEIFNLKYQKFQRSRSHQEIDSLRKLLILFNKS